MTERIDQTQAPAAGSEGPMPSNPEDAPTRGGVRRRRLRLLSLAIGALVVVAGTLVVMNLVAARANGADAQSAETGEDKAKAPVPVEVAEISSGTVSAYISATANLVADNDVKVLSEIEGRVSRLFVEEGDPVRQGQPLVTLVRDDQEILLKKAELREANAKLGYDRARDLVDKELISREEFDKLTIEYEIARQELAESQWNLEKTTIRAPISGRLTGRMTQVGQHVRPGDELFQVTDFEPLIARIFLPERDVLALTAGREVRIRLNADDGVRFGGAIRQVSPVVDTATGTVKVTIEARNPPPAVRPGSFVTIDIVRETRPGALLLPRESVLRELQKAHVFVAREEKAEKRPVTLGLEEGPWIEALSGVAAGDRVIVAGQGGLKDGSPIKVFDAEEGAG